MLKQRVWRNKEILILIGVFILFKLIFFFRFHDIWWDEAVYIGMSKYLFSLGKLGLFEILRPIIIPIILGFFWKIGLNVILVGEIIQLLFSVGCIYLTYKIGLKLKGKITGLVAALLLTFMPLFILNSQRIVTGIPSMFFCLLALNYFIDKKIILSGVFVGLAFLVRFPQGLMLIVLVSILVVDYIKDKEKKLFVNNILKIGISFFLTVLPFFIFNYFMYRNTTPKFYYAIFRPLIYASEVMRNNIWIYEKGYSFYLVEIFKECFVILIVLVALFFFIKKKYYLKRKFYAVLLSLLWYLIYFSFILGHKEYRYCIVFLPFIFLFVGIGMEDLYCWSKKNKLFNYIVMALLILIIASQFGFMIKQDITYIGWRYKNEPDIVSEYYKYFENNNISGKIMTTDPVFVAYGDNKLLPIYYDLNKAIRIYDQNKEDTIAIAYTPRSFPCQESDNVCLSKKEELSNNIKLDFNLKFKGTYYENEYYIYLKK